MKEILERARERIASPENWIQGRVSDSVEFIGSFKHSRAQVLEGSRWSIVGAVYCETDDFKAWDNALMAFGLQARLAVIRAEHPDWSQKQIDEDKTPSQIATFNDNHGHEEVLAVLDEAIRRAES